MALLDKPRLNSTNKIIAVVLAVVTALGGASYATWRYYKSRPKPNTEITTQGGIEPSFFKTPNFPQPEPKKEVEVATRELPPPPPAPPTAPPVPVAPPPPTKELLFKNVQKPGPDPSDPASEINARRRGHTVVEFLSDKAASQVSLVKQREDFLNANRARKWDEERTEASLPLDMSRVVNVAKHIPAILETEINSALPGKAVATIEENIYGSHGRLVLIPGGSKAVGRYKPLGKQGETRLAVIWERIITYPDGIDIPLVNAEMSDGMGRSGIAGDLDSRFMDRYGMALFVSILGALAQTQIPVDNRAAGLAVESIGNTSASMAKTILDKNIDLKPIVTIPQGTRITISAQRDVWFKSAADGKVQAVALTNNGRKQ